MPTSLRRTAVAGLAVVALLAGACAGGRDPGAAVTDDDRVAVIESLRRDVGPAASQVGTAAATVVAQLDDLHTEWPADLETRQAAADAVDRDTVAALADALDGFGPGLAGDATTAEAEATRDALARAADAGTAVRDHARRDVQLVTIATDAERRLAELVATWEAPGSRSQQLARLERTVVEATALADDLAATEDVPACTRLLARREGAARSVASASEELRELVAARRGSEFDQRRRELLDDPYGTGRPLAELDRADAGCWRDDAPVATAFDELEAALEELETVLNPPDLAG